MADKTNIAQTSQPVVKISFGDPKAINEGDTQINQQATTQFKKEKDISKVSDKARQSFGLKDGQTTATGLEKAIFIAGDGILKAQFAIDGLFYGKFSYAGENKFKKALDKGVVNVLNDLSEIDLCNVLNYALQQVPGSEPFDPEKKPTTGGQGAAKYYLQYAAFTVQKEIDGFSSSYLESSNEETKAKGVYDIINKIKDAFKEINDPEAQSALRDPRLTQSFPQLGPVNTFLEKAFNDFYKYSDYRQIPSSELQKLIDQIDKVRAYTILIQGLSTPANAIGFVDSVFPNANIQELIKKVEKIIDPAKLMPLLKNIVESLKKIQSVCNVFASFIAFGQSIIKISTLIIKVLKILVKFLKVLPIPNQFTILGVTNTVSGFCEDLLKKLNALLDRLSQINTLLSLCIGLLSQVIIVLYDIIAKINRMLVSLESCNNADPQIIKDLQDSRDGLQKTADYFQKFVNNYNTKKNTDTASFGDYTIQIVTEEVVDDAIRLRRRYGVALATNGTLVAQSTPTFASDNQIIINEVKALLSSKGFVKSYIGEFSPSELNTISESLSFVLDDDITLGDIENIDYDSGLDSGNNENENDGLGLNAFMNKLQGGKKLRERMRKIMIKNNLKLTADLKAQDPEGKFSKNLVKQKENETNKLKIDQLESEKSKLVAAMIASPSPIFKATMIIKIKEKQQEIDKLKKQGQ
jgi:hypothetical protein